jgi:hypothetical protein
MIRKQVDLRICVWDVPWDATMVATVALLVILAADNGTPFLTSGFRPP